MIRQTIHDTLLRRVKEPRRFLQVLAGLRQGKNLVALEVKSGRGKESLPGMEAFAKQYQPKRQLQVDGQGLPLEEFLSKPAEHWLR